MKIFWLVVAALLGCSESRSPSQLSSSGGIPRGELRGYASIENSLRTTVYGSDFELRDQLGDLAFPEIQSMFGGFDPATGTLQNTKPSAMNMLLWKVMFDYLAEQSSLICTDPAASYIWPAGELYEQIESVCEGEPLSYDSWQQVWISLTGFRGTPIRFEEWFNFVKTRQKFVEPTNVVYEMMMAAWLHPDYLLER